MYKREDFEIQFVNINGKNDCGWYVHLSGIDNALWKDLQLHNGTGWSKSSRKYGEAPGYYATEKLAEETLNKFLLKEAFEDSIKHFEDSFNAIFSDWELEKLELPTKKEVIEAAKQSEKAALEISIRKWYILSELPDEMLNKLNVLDIGGEVCGLCQRSFFLEHKWCRKRECCLFDGGNCCQEWKNCKNAFNDKNWNKFREAAKVLVERLEGKLKKELKKGEPMGKTENLQERLAQNKADQERLKEEERKLEGELEKQNKFDPQHGDFAYWAKSSKDDPIIFLKTNGIIRPFNKFTELSGTVEGWKVEIVGNIFKGDKIGD